MMRKLRRSGGQRGLTLLELVITMAILAVLAAAVIPMAEISVKRSKEIELRRSQRLIRAAIDRYHDDWLEAAFGDPQTYIPEKGETGFPEDLEVLVEGVDWGEVDATITKYLRRIPRDPFDVYDQGWGLRSYEDEPDSTFYSGEDVYDVYSQSDGVGLDGTDYNTW